MDGVETVRHPSAVVENDEGIYAISGKNVGAGIDNSAFEEHLASRVDDQTNLDLSFSKRFQALTLAWSNIDVHTIPQGGICRKAKSYTSKHILKNVSGIVQPGSFAAIMGASGAGKTTLMNVLTYRSGNTVNVSGLVTVNGQKVDEEISNISAYIQQEDVFIPTLTVREQLIFRACLRMDKSNDREMRMARVDEVIKELNLVKCQNTLIGDARIRGISGGERKRLSFASEILTDPPLIFLDEPTSGLDSYLARNLVATLRDLAACGRTIIATIHQPSSEVFSMFDHLILLAEGEVAFIGPTKEALILFRNCGLPCPTNYNPADFYLDKLSIISGQDDECYNRINLICDSFSKSERCKLTSSSIKDINDEASTSTNPITLPKYGKRFEASRIQQFCMVLWRSWLTVIRDPASLRLRAMQTIMISLVFGLIYLRQNLDQEGVMNINGFLFILVTNMSFSSQFIVINIFPMEIPVFQREYDSKLYSIEIYFLCKTLADIPFQILFPFIFITIDYWMIGLCDDVSKYFIACGIVILISNVAASFGYMISCLARTVTAALALAPPLMVPLMIFGGIFVNNKSIPSYFVWLKYLSWFKYATEILTVDQWIDVKNITCNEMPCIQNGEQVLKHLGFEKDKVIFDLYMLFVLLVAFRLFAYIFLVIRTKRCSRNCC